MPEDIHRKYERRHLINIANTERRVRRAYRRAVDKIFAGQNIPTGEVPRYFRTADIPGFTAKLDKVLAEFRIELNLILVSGMRYSWMLANEKTTVFINKNFAGLKHFPRHVTKILYDPNLNALEAFKTRKTMGLNLSDRVWKYTDQFRSQIEQTVYQGISRGVDASKMAAELKTYLQEPDRLFRRVRNADGQLVLSKAAKRFHPGRGVYRSSYKNAMRLARTETNMAYRMADMNRYKNIPFVLGYEVKLSPNHPKLDMCDDLKGQYPVGFIFRGWHPHCLCYVVPVMADDQQFSEYQDAVMNGDEEDFRFKDQITDAPQVRRWVRRHAAEIEGWKRLPYFMRENRISLPVI